MTTQSILAARSSVLIFAYSPAGFGHLRVTDALYDGLDTTASPILLGAREKSIQAVHRLFSVHPLFLKLFESAQDGTLQQPVTRMYRGLIRRKAETLYRQLNTILDQRIELPEQVILVATHFGLAHQLAEIKARIEHERKIRIMLVVQVTDDSPQYIWYVPEADLTFVPSAKTKEQLHAYARQYGYDDTQIHVSPYPVNPLLSEPLSEHDLRLRHNQFEETSSSHIRVSIPVSGAAVGLEYYTKVIDRLYYASHRFMFHIVTRSAPFTLSFMNHMIERPYCKLYVSTLDRQVVQLYDNLYRKYVIGLEITKPSEQAFKALVRPGLRGGSILLFTRAVGRQEYDNLNFLQRHGLIPSDSDNAYLHYRAEHELEVGSSQRGKDLLEEAVHWRGILLPDDPDKASCFIWWCYRQGVFSRMNTYRSMQKNHSPNDPHPGEVRPDGVELFWQTVSDKLHNQGGMC